jgi:RNA polymerase sigma-70 factor (ECF subfamily)
LRQSTKRTLSTNLPDTEKELLALIAEGHEPAFRVLYDRYWEKLFNYLVHITKSREIAEEIVADVFLKLWTGRDLLQNIQHMDGFLRKVAYNKAMDFFKIASRDARLQKVVAAGMSEAVEADTDNRLLDNEYRQILQEAVQQLSPQRRLIFSLSREAGLTHEQIARRLNLSRHTVRNSMAEALKSIREYLRRYDIDTLLLCWIFFTC